MRRIDRVTKERTDFQARHWEEHWEGWSRERVEASIVWEGILPVALRAFPRGSRLLEAGCGVGKYCIALAREGYDVMGLDLAESGLAALHRLAPEIPAIRASVLAMPFPDQSFDGALSLGVVEHFEEGPGKAIRELARVIRPRGRLLLTVPLQNLVSELNELFWPEKCPETSGQAFYQYLHTKLEIVRAVEQLGFRVLETRYIGRRTGLYEFKPFVRGHKATLPKAGVDVAGNSRSMRSWVKEQFPIVTSTIRRVQLRLLENILPGPVFAHTVALIAERE